MLMTLIIKQYEYSRQLGSRYTEPFLIGFKFSISTTGRYQIVRTVNLSNSRIKQGSQLMRTVLSHVGWFPHWLGTGILHIPSQSITKSRAAVSIRGCFWFWPLKLDFVIRTVWWPWFLNPRYMHRWWSLQVSNYFVARGQVCPYYPFWLIIKASLRAITWPD